MHSDAPHNRRLCYAEGIVNAPLRLMMSAAREAGSLTSLLIPPLDQASAHCHRGGGG